VFTPISACDEKKQMPLSLLLGEQGTFANYFIIYSDACTLFPFPLIIALALNFQLAILDL
jgi:hypothetical protein